MSLYTKMGDEGYTVRPGGGRIRKSDPLIQANGVVDELNAFIGLALRQARAEAAGEIADDLAPIAGELMAVEVLLAAAGAPWQPRVALDDSAVARMERRIDRLCQELPELRQFIIPGGSELACRLHAARTVCRRAERAVVAAIDGGAAVPAIVLRYLNRMSDLLFVLARQANRLGGVEEELWEH